MSIKATVFDLGKVLLDFDYRIAARRIAPRANVSVEELTVLLNQSALLHRYETGLLSSEEFYCEVRAATGFRGDLAEFGPCFGEIFSPIEPMIALHAELRQHGYPTYIFSNTNELAVQGIRRNFPFFGNFDGYICSFEHRVMKPDARLYEVVEQKAGCRGGGILYIDDRRDNAEAGAARGWQVILHENPEKTIAQVKHLGLL